MTLLPALLERPGQIVTREEIKEKLWPDDTFVDFDKSLNTAVQKLRQALGDSAESPRFIVGRVQAALNKVPKPVNGSKNHVLGVAYKRDISDVRESPALDIIGLLQRLGGEVTYSDPFVPKIELESGTLESSPVSPTVAEADCVVVITDHSELDCADVVA